MYIPFEPGLFLGLLSIVGPSSDLSVYTGVARNTNATLHMDLLDFSTSACSITSADTCVASACACICMREHSRVSTSSRMSGSAMTNLNVGCKPETHEASDPPAAGDRLRLSVSSASGQRIRVVVGMGQDSHGQSMDLGQSCSSIRGTERGPVCLGATGRLDLARYTSDRTQAGNLLALL